MVNGVLNSREVSFGVIHSQNSQLGGLARLSLALYKAPMEQTFTQIYAGPDKDKDEDGGAERGVATKVRPKTKKPSMWRVLLMNDDYTPMEFVVSILMGIFNKTSEEATQIMLNVHQSGVGTCGVYTFEVAETKVAQVMDSAKRAQHPLQCTLEKA
jgi:ATP-dependent Clp protease adaptor protein ClpS